MKQKFNSYCKIQLLFSYIAKAGFFILALAVFSLGCLFQLKITVVRAAAGDWCETKYNEANNNNQNSFQCGPGLTCNASNQCIAISGSSAGTNPASNITSGGLAPTCTGATHLVGGICVPNNPYTDGIAGSADLAGLITTVIKWLLFLSGMIAVVMIIVGGFWYMTAEGNEERAEKGRKALINAIIGLVVVILAYAIVVVITNLVTKTPGS